jgi:hypothetical protein
MMKVWFCISAILSACPGWAQEFESPVRLKADDAPIDTEIGHAAPYVYDFDRDGKRDLLVGQFLGGKLRTYRNVGTNEKPVFGAVEWFKVGEKIVTTPAS